MNKVALAFLTALVCATCVYAQNTQPLGKLAPKPLYRDPLFDGAADPSICFNAEQNKWLMYYTQRRATVPYLKEVEWVHGSNIGIAESSDGGATWKYVGTAGIDYGKDQHPNDFTYWSPEVIWDKGLYHMYLVYVPGIFTKWGMPVEMVYLTSQDGLKWDSIGPVDLHSNHMIDPCVMQLPNGAWRMWYRDDSKKPPFYCADSTDLQNWTPRGGVIPYLKPASPKVFHWKGKYWLLAAIKDAVQVWVSENAQEWYEQERRLCGTGGDVVVSGDRAWWFYVTNSGRKSSINVAELSVVDGHDLVADPNKPTYIDLKPAREEEK